MHTICTVPRSVGYRYGYLQFDELSAMWLYICMILILCSRPTPAMFCDATMYIYYNSTALEPH